MSKKEEKEEHKGEKNVEHKSKKKESKGEHKVRLDYVTLHTYCTC
jgi:hypothetical protein